MPRVDVTLKEDLEKISPIDWAAIVQGLKERVSGWAEVALKDVCVYRNCAWGDRDAPDIFVSIEFSAGECGLTLTMSELQHLASSIVDWLNSLPANFGKLAVWVKPQYDAVFALAERPIYPT